MTIAQYELEICRGSWDGLEKVEGESIYAGEHIGSHDSYELSDRRREVLLQVKIRSTRRAGVLACRVLGDGRDVEDDVLMSIWRDATPIVLAPNAGRSTLFETGNL